MWITCNYAKNTERISIVSKVYNENLHKQIEKKEIKKKLCHCVRQWVLPHVHVGDGRPEFL